ncbi:MAG: DUF2064 domain-containing protein [Flavobacteriales bacterium]|nr:DUF2064 domain-containing protein [Flavobacteriales bacterium]
MGQKRTAILYFAYRPDVEALRKPIFKQHGHEVNVRFYKELQEELFGQLTPLGLPVEHIDERQQHGHGFGERFCNAIEDVWARGYDQVIILGNDTPELDASVYQQAYELLRQDKTCLVKTHRNGVALIALQKERYYRHLWMELPWQSERIFDELFDCMAFCKVLGPDAIELNNLADVFAYLEMHRGKDSIAFLIESILNPLRNFVSLHLREKESGFISTRKLRGPPFTC